MDPITMDMLAEWMKAQRGPSPLFRNPLAPQPRRAGPTIANQPKPPAIEDATFREPALSRFLSIASGFGPAGDLMAMQSIRDDFANQHVGLNTAVDALSLVPGLIGSIGDAARSGQRLEKYTRGRGKVTSIRDMTPEQAREAALREDHLKQAPDGQFIGAPRGVNSPKTLKAMRKRVDAEVERGVEGGPWYDRAREGIIEVEGQNPQRQQLAAQEYGFWSPQATPDINLNDALRARVAYEAGAPRELVRTGRQGLGYIDARTQGKRLKQGPKTGEFENKLDPTVDFSHIPVNDIWQGRVFGYTDAAGKPMSSGYTAAQHAVMDGETTLAALRANKKGLGGKTDWNAASIQAAPWVYAKGRSLHERFPKKYPTIEAGVAEASRTYVDYYPKYTVSGTYEVIPGASTGHLPSMKDAPFDTRLSYSQDPRAAWTRADDGRDALYDAAGLPTRRTVPATGAYRNSLGEVEVNPAFTARPLMGIDDIGDRRIVQPEGRSIADAVEGFRSFIDGQEAGAWHKMLPEKKAEPARSLAVPYPRSLTPEEMRKLTVLGDQYGFGISDTGTGVSLMNNSDILPRGDDGALLFGREGPRDGGALSRGLRNALGNDLARALPDQSGPAQRATVSSSYLPSNLEAANAGTGRATQTMLDRIPDAVATKLDNSPELRKIVANKIDLDREMAGKFGGVREDLQRARDIFVREGLTGLRQALAAGVVLPAAAMMVVQRAQTDGRDTPAVPRSQ